MLFSSLKNFERGDFLYTWVQDNELVFYSWVSVSAKKHWNNNINELIATTGDNILFYDAYVLGDKINLDIFKKVMQNIISNHNDKDIYLVKPLKIRKGFLQGIAE